VRLTHVGTDNQRVEATGPGTEAPVWFFEVPRVLLVRNGAKGRVSGCDNYENIVGEDEIVEILEFNKSLTPAHVIQSLQRLVAAETEVEDSHVRVVAGDIADHLLDCLVVEFNDGNLANPPCKRGDHHIKELALAGRWNVPRTAGIDVPKDHTRCDSGSMIIAR
jgi:hypothetical protein